MLKVFHCLRLTTIVILYELNYIHSAQSSAECCNLVFHYVVIPLAFDLQ
jgi:hypothetical protein